VTGREDIIGKLGQALDAARELVGELKDWSPLVLSFTERAFGPAIREAGLLAGDVVGIVRAPFTAFRLKCLGAILRRAQQFVGDADVTPLPTGYAVSMLDAMKDVDDPTLQELWAGLLASSLTHRKSVRPRYIQLLRGLAPIDAAVFEAVMSGAALPDSPDDELKVTVLNLGSLDLLDHSQLPKTALSDTASGAGSGVVGELFVYSTHFGREFFATLTARGAAESGGTEYGAR
jgi:hypothetical protein